MNIKPNNNNIGCPRKRKKYLLNQIQYWVSRNKKEIYIKPNNNLIGCPAIESNTS